MPPRRTGGAHCVVAGGVVAGGVVAGGVVPGVVVSPIGPAPDPESPSTCYGIGSVLKGDAPEGAEGDG